MDPQSVAVMVILAITITLIVTELWRIDLILPAPIPARADLPHTALQSVVDVS